MKTTIATLVLLTLAGATFAKDKPAIIEKTDTPLAVTYYVPGKTAAVHVNQGPMHLYRYTWHVYPVLVEKMNHSGKEAALRVTIDGPFPNGVNLGLTVAIDGEATTLDRPNDDWTTLNMFGGGQEVSALFGDAGLIKKMAAGKEVYVTITDQTTQYSAKLSDEQLSTLKLMMSKYDTLAPTDQQ